MLALFSDHQILMSSLLSNQGSFSTLYLMENLVSPIIDTVYFPKGLETETRAQIYPCLELRHHVDITDKAKETKQAKCDYLVYLSERSMPTV